MINHSLQFHQAPSPCKRLLRFAERNPRRAVHLARRTLAQTPQADLPRYAWMVYTLGWSLLRWERFAESSNYIHQAQTLFGDLGWSRAVLDCRHALLLIAQLSGSGAELQTAWETLAADYTLAHLSLEAARVRFSQMAHLNILGRPHDVLAIAHQIEPLIWECGSNYDRARLLRIIAIAKSYLGSFEQALLYLDQSVRLFVSLHCWIEVAKSWFERSWINQRYERFTEALEDLNHALAMFKRHDLPLQLAFCEKRAGLIAGMLGRYDQALAYGLHARTQFIALGRRDHVATCDLDLGNIAYYSGLFHIALVAYRRAQLVYAEMGIERMVLVSQRNQALVLRALQHPLAALELLTTLKEPVLRLGDGLELAEQQMARAQILRDLGNWSEALVALASAYTQFIHIENRPAAAECLLEQGWLHLDQQEIAQAEECLRTALSMLAERPIHAWRAEYGLGRCAEVQGDIQGALSRYQAAGTIIAMLRRRLANEQASSGLFTQAQQLYSDALRLAVELNAPLTLLTLAEQQRALALHRRMTTTPFHFSVDMETLYEQQHHQLRHLMRSSISLEALDTALIEYIDLLLRARYVAPLPDDISEETIDWITLRQQLDETYPEGWTALVYIECAAELLIVIYETTTTDFIRIPFDTQLRSLIEQACLPRYRRSMFLDMLQMYDPTQQPWTKLTELSARLLPSHLHAHLNTQHRLLIIPSGSLHAIPWAALRMEQSWLCEKAIIQLLPSFALWSTITTRTPFDNKALLIGCSEFGDRAVNLPNALTSLDLVESLWPGPITRLENAAATRHTLIDLATQGALRQYRLVYIASHAQMVAARGLLAHLKLYNDDLLFDEVANLHLDGAMVILAACDGAVGEILPGEEVLSLSRAFLAAGASMVIASLWQVYDNVVYEMLEPLCRALAQGQDGPTALAYAQRTLIAQYDTNDAEKSITRSPLVWASLCALGADVKLQ